MVWGVVVSGVVACAVVVWVRVVAAGEVCVPASWDGGAATRAERAAGTCRLEDPLRDRVRGVELFSAGWAVSARPAGAWP